MKQAQLLFNHLHFDYLELRGQEEFVNFTLGIAIEFDKEKKYVNFRTFGRTDYIPFDLIKKIIVITEIRKRELGWC